MGAPQLHPILVIGNSITFRSFETPLQQLRIASGGDSENQYYGGLYYHLWRSDGVFCADDGSGVNWPLQNENIANLKRQLRSSKADVYYHLPFEVATSSLAPETSSVKQCSL